ncbi:hypothetical protein M5K25_016122 [Dendrobium thyrsiflorum]|uniref:Uncharacterized protein n=1 Tax=Dendrobium thyrsiflorum TaxID=117978 RepID=A0ABD0USE5_DENTH
MGNARRDTMAAEPPGIPSPRGDVGEGTCPFGLTRPERQRPVEVMSWGERGLVGAVAETVGSVVGSYRGLQAVKERMGNLAQSLGMPPGLGDVFKQ